MKHIAFRPLVTLVVLLLICGNTYALIDSEVTRRTLKGLKAVHLIIDKLPEQVVEGGLTSDAIRADVESKLRLAGIAVLSQEESFKEKGKKSSFLHILVTIGKQAKDRYVCLIRVELAQEVFLVRSPDVIAMAQTWSTGKLFLGMTIKDIREEILNYVDKFIDAYLSVNPKK